MTGRGASLRLAKDASPSIPPTTATNTATITGNANDTMAAQNATAKPAANAKKIALATTPTNRFSSGA